MKCEHFTQLTSLAVTLRSHRGQRQARTRPRQRRPDEDLQPGRRPVAGPSRHAHRSLPVRVVAGRLLVLQQLPELGVFLLDAAHRETGRRTDATRARDDRLAVSGGAGEDALQRRRGGATVGRRGRPERRVERRRRHDAALALSRAQRQPMTAADTRLGQRDATVSRRRRRAAAACRRCRDRRRGDVVVVVRRDVAAAAPTAPRVAVVAADGVLCLLDGVLVLDLRLLQTTQPRHLPPRPATTTVKLFSTALADENLHFSTIP